MRALRAADGAEWIGHYRVLSTLARGGMGVVYRAIDPDGRHVAVKTITDLHPLRIEGLRREAHILGKLAHPGVVRLLGAGDERGDPYYAMELLEGALLSDVVRACWPNRDLGGPRLDESDATWAASAVDVAAERAGNPGVVRTRVASTLFDVSLSEDRPALIIDSPASEAGERNRAGGGRLPVLLSFFRSVCQTLAYIHGEGVIHCDLKPDNIVVVGHETPVLVDFGIMRRFAGAVGRETLEVDRTPAGTLRYMAPEQIRGDDVDARTDLYALGCMLFEAICGRPPFDAPSDRFLLEQHLSDPPPPPSSLVAGVPPALESLLLKLLMKDPDRRPAYAEEVSAVLESFGARCSPRLRSPEPAPYLNRPPFAGNEMLLADILLRASAARSGQGKCVLLLGPSGSGKTRMAAEAAEIARRDGFLTLAGECEPLATAAFGDPSARAALLRPFRALLRHAAHLCREHGASMTRSLLGPSCRLLDRYEPGLTSVPGYDEYAEPPPLPAQSERERTQHALAELIHRVSERQPLLLGIDDIQWADDLTMATLVTLARSLSAPLHATILLTCRSESPREELEDVLHGERAEVLRLGPLEAESLVSIAQGMLAQDDLPPALKDFIVEESGGSPFFIAEYLKYSIAARILLRDRGRFMLSSAGLAGLHRVGSIDELLTRRLDSLSPNARRLASAASILGRAWDFLEAGGVAGLAGPPLYAALDDLLVKQVLVAVAGGRTLRFLHDRLREAAYARLSEEDLRALHARAAEVVAGTPEGPDQYRRLAYHYTAAGASREAFHYTRLVGEHALSRGAYKEASLHLGSAVSLLERDEASGGGLAEGLPAVEEARLLRLYASALFAVGQFDAMGRTLLRAFRLLTGAPVPETTLGWAALTARVAVGMRLPDAAWSDGFFPLPRAREGLVELCHTVGALNAYYRSQGRMLSAIMADTMGALIGDRCGEVASFVSAVSRLGIVAACAGMPRRRDRWFDAAQRAAEGAGDPITLGAVLRNRGVSHWMRAEWGEARASFNESLKVMVPTGFAHEIEEILVALGGIECSCGRLDEAERLNAELLESTISRGHHQLYLYGLWSTANVELCRGHLDRASSTMREAEPYARRSGHRPALANTLATAAGIHHYAGRHEDARRVADEALSCVEDPSAANVHIPYVHWHLPVVYAEAWRRDRGSAAMERLARALCKGAQKSAFFYPLLAPTVARHKARLAALSGDGAEALRLYRKSIEGASRLGMPFEEAVSCLELGAFGESGFAGGAEVCTPEERRAARERATRVFSRLGSEFAAAFWVPRAHPGA